VAGREGRRKKTHENWIAKLREARRGRTESMRMSCEGGRWAVGRWGVIVTRGRARGWEGRRREGMEREEKGGEVRGR